MPNALAAEKSPYLLQHADNPVAWLPWGEAAFAKARTEQKPVFLSIGYSTCHWCHVMAHESFENAAIAALLNAHFVPVKVDREERPDVDRVYMTYVQALTGHGGWPLSAWLTPELKPFYGGTYYPPEDRPGRPGFPSLLRRIADGWARDREKLVAEAERVLASLREQAAPASGQPGAAGAGAGLFEAAAAAFELCFQQLYENFDPARGDFAGAPKFPRPSNLNFLFRVATLQGRDSDLGREALRMATSTLTAMARGGIHDQVGGGFHRYAVDEDWFVPHFEKMLYDQAQIAVNCLDARLATGDERFGWLARGVFDYVLRDLGHPAGGFYSAEDADSAVGDLSGTGVPPVISPVHGRDARATHQGKTEGAFYVWTRAELEAALGGELDLGQAAAAFFCDHFGVTTAGNVPAAQDPHGEFTGKNILRQRQPLVATAKAHGLPPAAASELLAAQLEKLRALRATRPRPHLDDKIITAWNGLMISALARGAVLDSLEGRSLLAGDEGVASTANAGERGPSPASRLLQAAIRAAEFIERELHDAARGVLFRCWRGGRGASEGFAEDYALLIAGLLDLYEATFDARWLRWAERLQQTMDALFWDESGGGYFNSAANATDLVLRLKEDHDGAEPSPNSIAAANLLRLAAIFAPHEALESSEVGRVVPNAPIPAHRTRALRTIGSLQERWSAAPHALPEMLCAIERALEPPRQLVLAGDPAAPDFQALVAVARERPGPRRTLIHAGPSLPWTTAMAPRDGRATAYLCEDFACRPPVTEPTELRRLLG
jgi:hypothetical protein